MKKLLILLTTCILVFSMTACSSKTTSSKSEGSKLKIGIVQIVEHPALDSARKGFVDALKEAGYVDGKNVEYKVENAQGEMANAQTIAKQFANDNLDMVLAIATHTAQAAKNFIKDKPILITAVTDPVAAGLVNSMDKPGTNVTGTTDMTPVEDQIKTLHEIFPNVKNLGILYNAGEANSLVQVKLARQVTTKLGIKLIESTASTSSDVNQAAQSLISKVDAIYIPTDNTIVSAIGAVIKVADSKKIPVIGSEKGQVEGGALFTRGIDYYELGKQTGNMAVDILKNGKKPQDMAIQKSDKMITVVNKKTMDLLGIKLPDTIMNGAEIIDK